MKLPPGEDNKFVELTKSHFGFLVSECGYSYNENQNMFDSQNIKVIVKQYERLYPTIIIWVKTEPDFTIITLDWILVDLIDTKETDKYLIDDNFKFYAKWCRELINMPIGEIKGLLLFGIKKRLINGIKFQRATQENYQKYLTFEDRKLLQYIQIKDPAWDLESNL